MLLGIIVAVIGFYALNFLTTKEDVGVLKANYSNLLQKHEELKKRLNSELGKLKAELDKAREKNKELAGWLDRLATKTEVEEIRDICNSFSKYM